MGNGSQQNKSISGQLTLRGIVIGCIGCAVLTASSIYVALKLGALPWPIIFAAILSLFLLKLISRNNTTLNEANVTHTIMSSGAMIAGGLAFTIPGAWMLGLADEIDPWQMLGISIAGAMLGLVASIALRKHFVEDAKLEYPIGEAAAQTLKAGDVGGSVGRKLFGALGIAGIYTVLRDFFKVIPAMISPVQIPGVAFGIYNSPMMLAVGFLVGTGMVVAWFAGAVIANFGIIVAGTSFGLLSTEAAQQIVSCLGMGCMMGCGIAVIVRDIIPKGAKIISKGIKRSADDSVLLGLTPLSTTNSLGSSEPQRNPTSIVLGTLAVLCVVVTLAILFNMPLWVTILVVCAGFVACAMSSQSVGQTGIDPMEIFGLIVLLLVVVVAQVSQVKLFFIAALVAVACGLAGDVMNDFKAGHILGTSPNAQWIGQGIGAIVGCAVSVFTICVLFDAYGADAFGVGKEFVCAQASVVATMVGGIPNPWAFGVGLAIGFVLYLLKLPSMMIGLGIYLPFYMSFSAFLGAMVKVIYDLISKKISASRLAGQRTAENYDEEVDEQLRRSSETGLIVASGVIGGESIVGIILALVSTTAILSI